MNHLETIVDNLNAIIFSFDKNGIFTLSKGRGLELLGLKPGEIVGMSVFDIYKDEPLIIEACKKALDGKASRSTVFVGDLAFDSSFSPVFDSEGKLELVTGISVNITRFVETGAELNKQKDRITRILEASNTGIWEWGLKKNELYYSPRWKAILGYTDEELPNTFKTFEDNLHPEDKDRMLKNVQEYLQKPIGSFEHEFRMKHKNGEFVWILNRSAVTLADDGSPIYMSGSHLDITKQVRKEKELQELKENLEAEKVLMDNLMENIPDTIYFKDKKSRFVRISASMKRKFQAETMEEIIGKTDFDFQTKESATKFFEDENQIIESQVPLVNDVVHVKTKSGEEIWEATTKMPLYDKNNQIVGTFGFTKDVTAIKNSEEKFRSLFQSSTIPLCNVDNEGSLILINNQFVKTFGYTLNDVPTLDVWWQKAYPDEAYRNWVLQTWGDALENASLKNIDIRPEEYKVTCKNGETRIVIIGGITLKDGFLATFIDVTERKMMEEKLLKSNQELEQFAYIASHDLQEPLRKIKSYSELLEFKYKDQLDEKASKYLDIITSGTERMQKLIDDLLSYSRVTTKANDFEPVSLTEIVNETKEILEIQIKEHNAIINFNKLPIVNGDPRQLVQVMQNLITNAIKFKGENSPVINISADEKNNFWLIKVEDNGIGFDSVYAERIFIIFQRLHARNEYAGTGIGLSICKKIVERHGGKIWAKSEPGEGSVFYIKLPR